MSRPKAFRTLSSEYDDSEGTDDWLLPSATDKRSDSASNAPRSRILGAAQPRSAPPNYSSPAKSLRLTVKAPTAVVRGPARGSRTKDNTGEESESEEEEDDGAREEDEMDVDDDEGPEEDGEGGTDDDGEGSDEEMEVEEADEEVDGDSEGDEQEEEEEVEEVEEDNEEEEGSGSDDDSEAGGSGSSTPDVGNMTKRQRSRLEKSMEGELLELPSEVKSKKILTAEEQALRRAEMARRRKDLSEKRNEEEKTDTINKLLMKQAPKQRRARGAEGTGQATPNEQIREPEKPKPTVIRWVSNRNGISLGVPEELMGTPFGKVFAGKAGITEVSDPDPPRQRAA